MDSERNTAEALASKVSRTATSMVVVYVFFLFYIFSFNLEILRMNEREFGASAWANYSVEVVSRLRAYNALPPYLACEIFEDREWLIAAQPGNEASNIDKYSVEMVNDRVNLSTYFDDEGSQCLVTFSYGGNAEIDKIIENAEFQIAIYLEVAEKMIAATDEGENSGVKEEVSRLLEQLQREDFQIDINQTAGRILERLEFVTGPPRPGSPFLIEKWIVDGQRGFSAFGGFGADYFISHDLSLRQSLDSVKDQAIAYLRTASPQLADEGELLKILSSGYATIDRMNTGDRATAPFVSISFQPQHLLVTMGLVVAFLQLVFFSYYSQLRSIDAEPESKSNLPYFPRLLSPEDPTAPRDASLSNIFIARSVWFTFLFSPLLLLSAGALTRFNVDYLGFDRNYAYGLRGWPHQIADPSFFVDAVNLFALFVALLIVGKVVSNEQDNGNFRWRNLPNTGHLLAFTVLAFMLVPVVGATTAEFEVSNHAPAYRSIKLWLYLAYISVWAGFVVLGQNGMKSSAISIFCFLTNAPIMIATHI